MRNGEAQPPSALSAGSTGYASRRNEHARDGRHGSPRAREHHACTEKLLMLIQVLLTLTIFKVRLPGLGPKRL